MSNLTTIQNNSAVESALVMNDLSKLTTDQRLAFYKNVCESVGLNPLTQPLAFITLNNRLTLYAKKEASEQLRKIHGVSTEIISQSVEGEHITVHIRARDKSGRQDEDIASIFIKGLTGENLANARMKAVTKAKRRVTLSICGLGLLDETELDHISEDVKDITHNPQITNPFQEEQKQIEAVQNDLGEYIVKGGKYGGQKLKDIDMFALDSYLQWALKAGEQKPLSANMAEFCDRAESYLKSIETPTSHIQKDEEIPF